MRSYSRSGGQGVRTGRTVAATIKVGRTVRTRSVGNTAVVRHNQAGASAGKAEHSMQGAKPPHTLRPTNPPHKHTRSIGAARPHVCPLPRCTGFFGLGDRRRSALTNLGGSQTLLGALDDEVNHLLGAEVVLQPLCTRESSC